MLLTPTPLRPPVLTPTATSLTPPALRAKTLPLRFVRLIRSTLMRVTGLLCKASVGSTLRTFCALRGARSFGLFTATCAPFRIIGTAFFA